MGHPEALTVLPVTGMPEVRSGDDLAGLILDALAVLGLSLASGDVLVVSSKVVSKALGLRASACERDTVIEGQTRRVVAERRSGERVTRVVHSVAGPVMAAAGVDASNTGPRRDLLLLPADPDRAAADLLASLRRGCRMPPTAALGVVLSDTAGRPWRAGQVDFALGSAGVVARDDLRGGEDGDGRSLSVTERAVADELASAADLVKGKAEGVPVALLRRAGSDWAAAGTRAVADAGSLVRTGARDWFGHGSVEAVRAALGVEPGSAAAGRIGLPDVRPEPLPDRLRRAVALALHGQTEVAADLGAADVRLTGSDPYAVGHAAARLDVALWSEGLVGKATRGSAALDVLMGITEAPDH